MLPARSVAVITALVLLIAQFVSPAYAEMLPGAVNPRVNVRESIARIYVYPDGSVQPYYKLVATVDLGSDTGLHGAIHYVSRSVFKANSSDTKASLVVDLRGVHVAESRGLDADARWRYRGLGGGSGDAVLSLVLSWWNSTTRSRVVVKELRIEAQGGERATLYLDVVAPTKLLEKLFGRHGLAGLSPSDINRRLEENNIDYVRIRSLSVSMFGNGTTEVKLTIDEDIVRMVDAAVANGMPDKDARTLLRLLRGGARVTGEGRLVLGFRADTDKLYMNMSVVSSDRGDLEDAELLAQKAMPLLLEAVTYLVKPYVEQNPEPALIITQLQMGLREGVTPLVHSAPSVSNTTVKIVFRGRYVDVYLEYYGARVRVPSREAPSIVAEKTLTVVSQQLSQALQSLGVLQAYAPGLSAAIPSTVELVPVGGVKLSRTRVTVNQLPLVRVTIVAAPTRTVTPTAPPATHTGSTAPVTGSPATGSKTASQPAATATPPPPPPPATSTQPSPTGTAPATTPVTAAGARGGGMVSTGVAVAVVVLTLAVVAAAAALLLRRGQA